MFIYNKKLKFMILCVIFININQNVANIYFGLHILITDRGIQQKRYSFQKLAPGNGKSTVKFHIGEYDTFNYPIGSFPELEDVDQWLHYSFHESSVFPDWTTFSTDYSFSVTVYLGIISEEIEMDKYMCEFFDKIKDYFKPYIQMGIDITIDGIRWGPIGEAIMLYFGQNFDFDTNQLTPRNIINVSSEGTTIAYVSTLRQLNKLEHVDPKLYYSKLAGRTNTDILFATRATCFTIENIERMSHIHFISISKLEGTNSSLVKDHPCVISKIVNVFINEEDERNDCIKYFIGPNIQKGHYAIVGKFNVDMCIAHLKEVLKRNIVCKSVHLCWLNFDSKIFAKPKNKYFYLSGGKHYGETTRWAIDFPDMKKLISETINKQISARQRYEKLNEQIEIMYFVTLMEMLVKSIGAQPYAVFVHITPLQKTSHGSLFLDGRLRELFPQTQVHELKDAV